MSAHTSLLSFNSFYIRSELPSGSILLSSTSRVSPFRLYDSDLFIVSSSSSVDLRSQRFLDLLSQYPSSVLLRISHLSTNFRDRGDLEQRIRSSTHSNYFIGSDFVGEVVAIGSLVTNLSVSDRVIPSHSYPSQGLVTTTASSGLLLVDSSRLLVIPNNLQDTVAASFSVPYQTAYSLVRRSGAFTSLKHALITAPTSTTSLAIMQILRFHNLPFTILARDQSSISKLNSMGFDRVLLCFVDVYCQTKAYCGRCAVLGRF